MPLATGQVLNNRYRIVKLIGQGGFGAVYRAWDTSLQQPCALKENLDASSEAQRQFQREAIILAGLRHSNLPRVTDHFLLPGKGQYLVMDFIEGQSLAEALVKNGGPLPEGIVLKWVHQVCEALEYLHSQNPPIIHRDIKPQNIIITPAGRAILVDFGISKIYSPTTSTTRGAQAMTAGYSPPEQYGKARTDARSDQYALAATLYYLLTAQDPPDAVERLIHKEIMEPVDKYNPAITPEISLAIQKAMELESKDRFPTITDFQAALDLKVRAVQAPSDHFLTAALEEPASLPTTGPVAVSSRDIPLASAGSTAAPLPISHPSPPGPVASVPKAAQISSAASARRPGSLPWLALFYFLSGPVTMFYTVYFYFWWYFDYLTLRFLKRVYMPPPVQYILWLNIVVCLLVIASIIGIVAGIQILRGKPKSRLIALIHSALLATAIIIVIIYLAYLRNLNINNIFPLALILAVTIESIVYLFQPQILDYFIPASAPHQLRPKSAINWMGWWHIFLGFWLIFPLGVGIGLLRRKNKRLWQVLLAEMIILCILAVAIMAVPIELIHAAIGNTIAGLVSYGELDTILRLSFFLKTWAAIIFALALQGVLYILHRDVRKVF